MIPGFMRFPSSKGLPWQLRHSSEVSARRAVVVATLADRALVVVKVRGKPGGLFAFIHLFQQDSRQSFGEEVRPVHTCPQGLYKTIFRDLLHRVSAFHRLLWTEGAAPPALLQPPRSREQSPSPVKGFIWHFRQESFCSSPALGHEERGTRRTLWLAV